MPRHPKLRKKKIGQSVYWFTKTGGDTYFGNIKEVAFKEAKRLFSQHVESVLDAQQDRKSQEMSLGDLMDLFLDWIEKHRSDRTYGTRKSHCNRFGKFKVKGAKLGDLPARKIRASDLEAWLEHLESEGHSAQTRRHAQTSIKHCWNWSTKHCPAGSNSPYLPPTVRPFASVERVFVSPKTLTENDLITDEEIRRFAGAEIDLDTYHRFGPKTPRPVEHNPYRCSATCFAAVTGPGQERMS